MASSRLVALAAVAGGLAGAVWYRRARRVTTAWHRRVVLITGGSRGLGLALAREFARRGGIVWIAARDGDEVDRAVGELRAGGGRAFGLCADVTDMASVATMVETVAAHHGRLDCVVNNAGVITAMPFVNAELSDFSESLATHFWGPLYVIRAALPWLRQAAPGHIVNISSVGGRVGVPHLAPYCAGKFALAGLSDVLNAELSAHDVHVTTVTPGLMRTGSIGHVKVRGRHVAEARWFAALAATSLTSQDATRAARQIVRAVSLRRATVTPGWQARALHVATTVAPGIVAPIQAAAATLLLPQASDVSTQARAIRDLDLGWAKGLMRPGIAAKYNEA
ncbi:MAG: SDR family NAD(P)-dependent oxidoreductase [Pseudolysinimonas sp.]